MKAVGYKKSLPVDDPQALIDFEAAKPEPRGHDIRVAVKAISANPVDYKVRKRAAPPEGETKILGYDAAGIVDAVGPEVTLFRPGDEVFYAGSILRQGTNSEFHLVDERIVGRKPKSLSFAQAAALPLTSITAWELLFDRLGAVPGKSVDPRTLLITGGAGGVGSILIQIARRLTGLTVVATATRPESQKWCLDLGAHAVVDHGKPIKEQIEKLKLPPVALVASLTFTEQHYKAIADFMAPQGRFGLIDDPPEFNVGAFKGKSISVHWESMFTPLVVPDRRHDRPARTSQRRLRSSRQRRAAYNPRQEFRNDQRRQSEACPCTAGERPVARQDRTGRLVSGLRGEADPSGLARGPHAAVRIWRRPRDKPLRERMIDSLLADPARGGIGNHGGSHQRHHHGVVICHLGHDDESRDRRLNDAGKIRHHSKQHDR